MKIADPTSTLTTEFEMVSTRVASRLLVRRPRTLQAWAREGSGPVKAVLVNSRYLWPAEQLRRVLAGTT